MTQMKEIKWNNFKAKFDGKEQKSFEQLCYLLFCDEFDQNKGIFRYKNQIGIETEPIQVEGKLIGFQAKFYETKISDNKTNIIDSIKKAKDKNQALNKILFYINQEFSESSKKGQKEPTYKVDIEKYASSKGVEIEWRVPSHFERQLALDKNKTLAVHFFSLGKSVINFINELQQHTESILAPIHSKIKFNDNEIKIDRSLILQKIKTSIEKSSLIILSGECGVGKTAVIKDYYSGIKDSVPFFVFKATEFNIPNINNLFKNYGNFTLSDFINVYQDIDKKYIIIDSSEKLSDIEHKEAFQEFLSTLINNNWKTIFTTRHSYLDDLKFQFIEVYHLSFQPINIEYLDIKELIELSRKHDFNLPTNERFLELLKNPFYLNEYLQNYRNIDETIDYSTFKNLLWNKQISKSSYRNDNIHIKREDCFLKIAKKRADKGLFFVKIDDCDDTVLQVLELDEIIKYDSNAGGYFITHDVYEEWALEKIIERKFTKLGDYKSFFDAIGSSLPIRRAFRSWLSEKLFNNQNEVKSLIEESIPDNEIENFWKDEILVSVLLSNYSKVFFQLFESKLLEKNQQMLMRIIFLLRIACKEIDEDFLKYLDLHKRDDIAFKILITKPKGSGWNHVIDFIHKHKEEFDLKNINVILPLLNDWNNENKDGETTKKASQIALYYFEEIQKNGDFKSNDDKKELLIIVILQGASEIKEELRNIFDEIINNQQTSHIDKYDELIKTTLTSLTDSFEVIKNLPEQVIKLADLCWFQIPKKGDMHSRARIEIDDDFCLSKKHGFNYFPASSFQTPILQLLRFAPKQTIDFILFFTNKTIECYSKSELKNEVEEVKVLINEKDIIEQYISERLWNMYRGTQVSPHLLESIHMALEKWLLGYAKTAPQKKLESLCLYLIKKSKSASITAVVASVVLAYPSKLFNITKILFQTKEFFFYDTNRFMLDQTAKSYYSTGLGLNDYKDKIYRDERIKTCNGEHRKLSLEHIVLNYQLFRTKEEDQREAEKRQKIIWDIFDKYYEKVPEKAKETEYDKTWRLYLARMDRRKMNPEVEEKDDQVLIKFAPELDPELKKYSEDSLQKSSEAMRHTSLNLWSGFRFRKEETNSKQYPQYENNPQLVIKETRKIIEGLKKKTRNHFSLFNHSIPAYTCSVLVRDYFDKLNKEEREFCKETIIEFASIPLQEHYQYQISDGTEPTIISLPNLFKYFSKDTNDIKSLLILLLLNPRREISTFAIRGIFHNLWEISFEDAQSIFLGYLFLSPKYDEFRYKIRKENYEKGIYEKFESHALDAFFKQYENEFDRIVSNKITYGELGDLDKLDLEILETAFELLPLRTNNEDHKKYIITTFPVFSKRIFIYADRIDYALKHRFLEKLAYFVLTSTKEEIKTYLKPFVENFSNSKDMADFFQEFISVEDRLNQYEEFWLVWNAFYEKIVELCKNNSSCHYTKEIVHNYLLAWPYWKEDAKEWHTLKKREKLFLKKVAKDIGYHPSVLYSLSKIINGIGSNFLEEGILWISGILQKNNNLLCDELETNTIYYIENIVRKYILTNRKKIKTTLRVKKNVLVILNFLIERGSVTGYLLREDIL